MSYTPVWIANKIVEQMNSQTLLIKRFSKIFIALLETFVRTN